MKIRRPLLFPKFDVNPVRTPWPRREATPDPSWLSWGAHAPGLDFFERARIGKSPMEGYEEQWKREAAKEREEFERKLNRKRQERYSVGKGMGNFAVY